MVRKKGKEVKRIEPIEMSFSQKLREDKVFLIQMIDDPAKAFRLYGFNGDDRMMAMLQGMSTNLRKRSILVFSRILRKMSDNACNACDPCL